MKIQDNQVRIIDNFLPQEIFKEFQSIFLNENFPWYFNDTSVYDNDNCPQFGHIIYMNMEPKSPCWEYIKPILIEGLNLKINQSILRVKVNATPATLSVIQKRLHCDLLEPDEINKLEDDENYSVKVCPHNVAIIYINTNDGFTYFKDGTKVESIENRCIIFPGNLMHSGSTCTNSPLRLVLNVNYTCE
jgi:hypothetical protein